jgi:hypothetical protein
MKKFVFDAFILALGLTACGNHTTKSDTTKVDTEVTADTTVDSVITDSIM